MSTQAPLPIDPELFEAFLDGRLSGAQAAAVEDAIRADPDLAAEAELHRRINDSLRTQFAPPGKIELPAPAPIPFRAPQRVFRTTWLAAAAALLLCVTGALWYTVGRAGPGGAEGLYRSLASTNFKPDWVCSDDSDFVQRVRYRFGEAFLVHADSAVALIGWKYVKEPLSPQALALMTSVDGEHSVILVDRVSHDKPLEEPSPASGLHLFRKEWGDLVLYEITPLKTSRILDLVYPVPKELEQPLP